MKSFRPHQRVQITLLNHDLRGKTGQVVRGRHCDDGAWVRMDEPLPEGRRVFPAGDSCGREDHIVLYPEYCEEIQAMPSEPVDTIPEVIAELRKLSAQIICPKDNIFANMADTIEKAHPEPPQATDQGELCQRCGEAGQGRRTLWMACLYAMEEMTDVPLVKQMIKPADGEGEFRFYTLRVCKTCRAHWMSAIQSWFKNEGNTE